MKPRSSNDVQASVASISAGRSSFRQPCFLLLTGDIDLDQYRQRDVSRPTATIEFAGQRHAIQRVDDIEMAGDGKRASLNSKRTDQMQHEIVRYVSGKRFQRILDAILAEVTQPRRVGLVHLHACHRLRDADQRHAACRLARRPFSVSDPIANHVEALLECRWCNVWGCHRHWNLWLRSEASDGQQLGDHQVASRWCTDLACRAIREVSIVLAADTTSTGSDLSIGNACLEQHEAVGRPEIKMIPRSIGNDCLIPIHHPELRPTRR